MHLKGLFAQRAGLQVKFNLYLLCHLYTEPQLSLIFGIPNCENAMRLVPRLQKSKPKHDLLEAETCSY